MFENILKICYDRGIIKGDIMAKLIDKALLFIILFVLLFFTGTIPSIIPVLIVLSFSCLASYVETSRLHIIAFITYIVLCIFFEELILFLPLLCYDLFLANYQILAIVSLFPILISYHPSHFAITILIFLFFVLSYFLKKKTIFRETVLEEYRLYRDKTKELSMGLEKKNQELMEKQDYEISIATLNERNRIAMEIHDNVGHLLSSSILQIGAITALNKDKMLEENLHTVSITLSSAMNSIRNSIHDIHEDSLQLEPQIKKIVEEFTFCPIVLDYIITNTPNTKVSYAFITIVKESLANIIKHSNATKATITLREHPGFYQLLILDNGTNIQKNEENGIGLKNMEERVYQLHGHIAITNENGFRIFITIPKEE